jgi:hypothetical protein
MGLLQRLEGMTEHGRLRQIEARLGRIEALCLKILDRSTTYQKLSSATFTPSTLESPGTPSKSTT